MRLRTWFLIGGALACAGSSLSAGTPREPGFIDTFVENGLESPTSMAWAPDSSNRLFVTLKKRGVRVVREGALVTRPFATFPKLHTAGECGVLGLCFDPEYVQNRYVYVLLTVSPHEQRVVRFTDVGDVGVARTTILRGLPTAGTIHNGGAIGFGHDGKLYWAIGDLGTKSGVDADLKTLASKVGRSHADGSVPKDNPFRDGPGPRNDFIWATGFRNPFSLTFQPRTGRLWLNVVGSDPSGQTTPNSGPGYEQVFAPSAGEDGGYDDYEGNQPPGNRHGGLFPRPLARPVIQYKTDRGSNPGQSRNLSSIEFDSGAIRVETREPHPYRTGQGVIISGTTDFDGTFVVERVLSSTRLVLPETGQRGSVVGAGTVRPLVQGSCIAGGGFYESSEFPLVHRGNFFYCDFSGGRILRAELDAEHRRVVGIQNFVTDARSPIDVAIGPDGGLFYAEFGTGSIRRVQWHGEPSDLVVTPSVLNVLEGGAATFAVRLGRAPASEVIVSIQNVGGDPDLRVESGGSLVFGPNDWQSPKIVTISAAIDDDADRDEAIFAVSAPGNATENVRVSVTDTSDEAAVLSTTALEIVEGKTATFGVSLRSPPSRATTFAVRRQIGRTRVRVVGGASLIFTPENYAVPQTVVVAARKDGNARPEVGSVTITGRGYHARRVTVTVVKDDPADATSGGSNPAAVDDPLD